MWSAAGRGIEAWARKWLGVVRKYSVGPPNSLKTVDVLLDKSLTVTGRFEPLNSRRTMAPVRLQSDTMSGKLQFLTLIRAGFGVVWELSAFLCSAVRSRSSVSAGAKIDRIMPRQRGDAAE
jgi:hypothetical protein